MSGRENRDSLRTGIVVERRHVGHPWQEYAWHPVALIPGASEDSEPWRVLGQGEGWVQYLAGTLDLELFAGETDGYRTNLSQPQPLVYVVLAPGDDDEDGHEVEPFLVTACPYEAEGYVESGDEIVEGVPMPDSVLAWVQDFIARHHVDRPFVKRKRKAYDPRKEGFSRGGMKGGSREGHG